MILSPTHKFIFIKGVKVAGTSIEIALAPFCGPDDIVTPITPIDELVRLEANGGARNYSGDPAAERAYTSRLRNARLSDLTSIEHPPAIYFNHMPLLDVLRLQGSAARDYRVVCVERNPYAKIFSWANHQATFSAYQTGGAMRSDWHTLRRALDHAIETRSILKVRNIDRYRGLDGMISARVMRFEHLDADFRRFLHTLCIDYQSPLPHAKKGILSNRLDPRDLLNRRQIALINELFDDEFTNFGYQSL